jgi:hypothetical protein
MHPGALHFPYRRLTLDTRLASILVTRMRKRVLILLAFGVFALPAAVYAASLALGDGTLSTDNVNGSVSVQARGVVIGRLEEGLLTITDRTPGDASLPTMWGCDDAWLRVDGSLACEGQKLRFRISGGGWKVVARGVGIDVSAVGRGSVRLKAVSDGAGFYSIDGTDCRVSRDKCLPVPETAISFPLGPPQKP